MAGTQQPFIRPVRYETDRPALDNVFRVTCGEVLKVEPAWTISSYLWCHPYPILAPTTCFVLDAGNSEGAVGYILSTTDTKEFACDWSSKFVPSLDRTLLPEPSGGSEDQNDDLPTKLLQQLYGDTSKLFNFSYPGLLDRWPGHLHINVLPEYQGQGWGRKMIETLLEALSKLGCSGVHLGMQASSKDALKFYTKLGFTRYPEVLDGGVSGELGRTAGVGAIYLVKDIMLPET